MNFTGFDFNRRLTCSNNKQFIDSMLTLANNPLLHITSDDIYILETMFERTGERRGLNCADKGLSVNHKPLSLSLELPRTSDNSTTKSTDAVQCRLRFCSVTLCGYRQGYGWVTVEQIALLCANIRWNNFRSLRWKLSILCCGWISHFWNHDRGCIYSAKSNQWWR